MPTLPLFFPNVLPECHEVFGRLVLPKDTIKMQHLNKKKFKPSAPLWFDIERPHSNGDGDRQRWRLVP